MTIRAQDGKQDESKEANTEYSSLSPSIFHYTHQELISQFHPRVYRILGKQLRVRHCASLNTSLCELLLQGGLQSTYNWNVSQILHYGYPEMPLNIVSQHQCCWGNGTYNREKTIFVAVGFLKRWQSSYKKDMPLVIFM